MASKHIRRIQLPDQETQRFWSKVNVQGTDDCWNWLFAVNPNGYGVFSIKHRNYGAHRIAYFLTTGIDPAEQLVCHTCDNRLCCNPSHLFLGTYLDNNQDRVKKGRSATGSRNGTHTHPERVARGDRNGTRLHPESIARGEHAGPSKLTENQVRTIRQRYARGGVTHRQLATEYGVTHTMIGYIIRGDWWQHIS